MVERFSKLAPRTATADRTVSFVVNDGNLDSAAADKTVSVAAVNDAPAFSGPAAVNGTPGSAITIGGTGSAQIILARLEADGIPSGRVFRAPEFLASAFLFAVLGLLVHLLLGA